MALSSFAGIVGSMPSSAGSGKCQPAWTQPRLYVEEDVQHVAVAHDVVFALQADDAPLLRLE